MNSFSGLIFLRRIKILSLVNYIKYYSTSQSTVPISLISASVGLTPVVNNSRSIGTLQLKLNDHNNLIIDHVVSQNIIDCISLKSLLKENPGVKQFILKKVSAINFEGEEHPFLIVVNNLFFQQDDFPLSPDTPGLLVYLLAQLFESMAQNVGDNNSTISRKILYLSKSINQSSAAFCIHRTIQEKKNSELWNKLSILTGDLLVVECIRNLANLEDNELLLWGMNSFADFSSFEFETQPQLNFTPEASLLSTGFKGVAKLYGRQDSLGQMDRLGQILGTLWIGCMHDDKHDKILNRVEIDLMTKEALNILDSQFDDCPISNFFRNFVLFSLH